jgi:DNA-directed RNA polymerase subunit RPC12/RpoP
MITLNGKIKVCKDCGKGQNPLNIRCQFCNGKLITMEKVITK